VPKLAGAGRIRDASQLAIRNYGTLVKAASF